jgi:hypothetical protein
MGEASSIHDCKGSHRKGQGRKDAAPATSIRTNARMPPAAVKIFRTAPKESSCVGMQLRSQPTQATQATQATQPTQATNQPTSGTLLFAFSLSLSPSGMPPSSFASARSWLCATRWRHAPHSNGPFRLVCLAWLWFSSTFTTQERVIKSEHVPRLSLSSGTQPQLPRLDHKK